jgi:hypothetical protein
VRAEEKINIVSAKSFVRKHALANGIDNRWSKNKKGEIKSKMFAK